LIIPVLKSSMLPEKETEDRLHVEVAIRKKCQ